MLYIKHYQSPLGAMTMSSNGEALTGLWFDCSQQNSRLLQGAKREKANNFSKVFEEAEDWLNIYFSGKLQILFQISRLLEMNFAKLFGIFCFLSHMGR